MVFKICEGISCSSFSVKEFDVIVHKIFSLYNPVEILATLYPKSLANLVDEVGIRHSHQILLVTPMLEIMNIQQYTKFNMQFSWYM